MPEITVDRTERIVQKWVQRLITALRRQAGHRLTDAETKADVKPGYLRKAQSRSGNVMMVKFLRICANARVDPADVFAEVFPHRAFDGDLGLVIPQQSAPPIVKGLRRRLAVSARPAGSPTALDPLWLDWLDDLRYDDPWRAICEAEHAASFVDAADLPRTLGIYASACRLISRYGDALLALRAALDLARERGERLAEADLLRRGAFLVASASANYDSALTIAERAASMYARHGKFDRVGQVLVDQGLLLFYLERFEEAEAALDSGLGSMTPAARRDRLAALHALASIARQRGDVPRAGEFLARAALLMNHDYERGKVRWLQACLATDCGDWGGAAAAFEAGFEHLLRMAPVDAALCACDHVRMLLVSGRPMEARQRAHVMRQLMEPLANEAIASAAIRDLIRSEQEGVRLTIERVATIKSRIQRSDRALSVRW